MINIAEENNMEMIPLIDCRKLPKEIEDDVFERYDYGCHYEHAVLQVKDDGNAFADWLKLQGYRFKTTPPHFDLVALYGT